jgi:hypothetical protein
MHDRVRHIQVRNGPAAGTAETLTFGRPGPAGPARVAGRQRAGDGLGTAEAACEAARAGMISTYGWPDSSRHGLRKCWAAAPPGRGPAGSSQLGESESSRGDSHSGHLECERVSNRLTAVSADCFLAEFLKMNLRCGNRTRMF